MGIEFHLMSLEKIRRFFPENQGKEFIGFDKNQSLEDRIKYYYFWEKKLLQWILQK